MAVFSTPPQNNHTHTIPAFSTAAGWSSFALKCLCDWRSCIPGPIVFRSFEGEGGRGGSKRRGGDRGGLNFCAACGAKGPNTFYDLVYLPAKHPYRIVICGRGPESIASGARRERDEETKTFWRLEFHPVSPSCPLCQAVSMPTSAKAGRCRHLSGALQCPGLLGMFAPGECDKPWPDSSKKERMYCIRLPNGGRCINKRGKKHWWTPGDCNYNFTWTTHMFTATDALICPLWRPKMALPGLVASSHIREDRTTTVLWNRTSWFLFCRCHSFSSS